MSFFNHFDFLGFPLFKIQDFFLHIVWLGIEGVTHHLSTTPHRSLNRSQTNLHIYFTGHKVVHEDLARWCQGHQYYVTLENRDNMFDNRYYPV